ncbi:MAG TPA: helix-turn-helix transcriptional regulator [Humibacter sp.]|nr:helix-turn-helix transcriptional regulator [Humibacter sp.]
MLLRHAYGSALRRARLRRGMTLRQLSQASSVSVPYLSEIERGRKEASSEILATVCAVLGLSVHDLLRETARELSLTAAPVLDLSARRDDLLLERRAETDVDARDVLLLVA